MPRISVLVPDNTAKSAGMLFPVDDAPTIPGLVYIGEFLDAAECDTLLATIDQQPWDCSLKRRVQQYGYRYNYSTSRLDAADRIGSLPEWMLRVTAKVAPLFSGGETIEQVIVNEYLPGQGIASHIDRLDCFGETVAILSLGSLVVMEFTRANSAQSLSMPLEPASLMVLQGESRSVWKHGIANRKSDRVKGVTVRRGRRVSLTFRSVVASRFVDGRFA